MNKIKTVLFILLGTTAGAFAQDNTNLTENLKPQVQISYLDSIKSTFRQHPMAACVDSLWLKELTNLDIYNDLAHDIKTINLDEKVDYELPTELLKKRLKDMDAKSPFHIEYNPGLENLIKSFLKNRKKAYERLMALSEYYFPVFEEAMAKYNVPLEIKYLAIVESALNPKAVSRVGATGLWQFMYQTGKEYNLDIDSYVDERSDPLKASEAAARYMSNMYKIFGDWDLVLASYNSGPGNVAKAIRRSGGQENFWNIRKNLPKETQGYVPAFLATMYIYEYHKEHGIVPNHAAVRQFATDTVGIKRQMTFRQIADLLDMPMAQLQLLNPQYKLNTIPNYTDEMHYLRLPLDKVGIFASNEDKIYAYIDHESQKRERPYFQYASKRDSTQLANRDTAAVSGSIARAQYKYHTVRRGESLGKISANYGVSIAEVKRWNKLRSDKAPLGRKLKIYSNDSDTAVAAVEKKETRQVVKEDKKAIAATEPKDMQDVAKAESNVNVQPQYYVVQKGDNLGTIAKRFGVSINDLKDWNSLEGNNVMLDAKLKILKEGGDAVAELKKDAIIKSSNSYVVQKGDNLSSIARKYDVSVADIQEWNQIKDNNINVGSKLLILKDTPAAKTSGHDKKSAIAAAQTHYLVRKGDSLFTIAKKYPGVTVSDIKKWNGISGNELKPGMKLKISG